MFNSNLILRFIEFSVKLLKKIIIHLKNFEICLKFGNFSTLLIVFDRGNRVFE